MIDDKIWVQQISVLENWFNTELSDVETAALYYSLNSKLNNEEFISACRILFEQHNKGRASYFPAANKFIEAIHGTLEDRANKVWVALIKAVRNNKGYEFEEVNNKLIRDAIASIGGIEAINHTPDQELKWIKKDFISALVSFKRLETQQNYLAAASKQKLLCD